MDDKFTEPESGLCLTLLDKLRNSTVLLRTKDMHPMHARYLDTLLHPFYKLHAWLHHRLRFCYCAHSEIAIHQGWASSAQSSLPLAVNQVCGAADARSSMRNQTRIHAVTPASSELHRRKRSRKSAPCWCGNFFFSHSLCGTARDRGRRCATKSAGGVQAAWSAAQGCADGGWWARTGRQSQRSARA